VGVVDDLYVNLQNLPISSHLDTQTHLDERLDLAPGRQLLLAHAFGHFSWVPLNASDDGVGERMFGRALIQLLDDDNFFAGLTALEDDGNLDRALNNPFSSKFHNSAYLAGLVYYINSLDIGSPSQTTARRTFNHLDERRRP
jgi:hypothetical protein